MQGVYEKMCVSLRLFSLRLLYTTLSAPFQARWGAEGLARRAWRRLLALLRLRARQCLRRVEALRRLRRAVRVYLYHGPSWSRL